MLFLFVVQTLATPLATTENNLAAAAAAMDVDVIILGDACMTSRLQTG